MQDQADDPDREDDETPISEPVSDDELRELYSLAKGKIPDDVRTLEARDGWIGPYWIEKLLGRGGMGEVFLVRRGRHRRALKQLKATVAQQPELLMRFITEARALNRLTNRHIVRFDELCVTTELRPIIVMEYVPGAKPIIDYINNENLSLDEILDLFIKCGEALSHVHKLSIIHRDIKSTNIIVDRTGAPKLIDFGLIKILGSDQGPLTRQGEVLGTPIYMSPEQARGEAVDSTTDIYSLGIVLYEALTGAAPVTGKQIALAQDRWVELKLRKFPGLEAARQRNLADDSLSDATRKRLEKNKIGPKLNALVMATLSQKPEDRLTPDKLVHGLRQYSRKRRALREQDESRLVTTLHQFVSEHKVAIRRMACVLAALLPLAWVSVTLVKESRQQQVEKMVEAQERSTLAFELFHDVTACNKTIEELTSAAKSLPAPFEKAKPEHLAWLDRCTELGKILARAEARGNALQQDLVASSGRRQQLMQEFDTAKQNLRTFFGSAIVRGVHNRVDWIEVGSDQAHARFSGEREEAKYEIRQEYPAGIEVPAELAPIGRERHSRFVHLLSLPLERRERGFELPRDGLYSSPGSTGALVMALLVPGPRSKPTPLYVSERPLTAAHWNCIVRFVGFGPTLEDHDSRWMMAPATDSLLRGVGLRLLTPDEIERARSAGMTIAYDDRADVRIGHFHVASLTP